MPNLFPQGYEEQLATVSDIERDEPVGYKPSAAFSFETGDFVRNGSNQVESVSGVPHLPADTKIHACSIYDGFWHRI